MEVCTKVPDSSVLPAMEIMDDLIHTAVIVESAETRSDPTTAPFEVHTYPNPTIDVLTIDLKGLQNERTFIRIHNLVGKMIKEVEVDPTTDSKLILNLSNELRTGMYYLHVHNGDRKITKPVIIIE